MPSVARRVGRQVQIREDVESEEEVPRNTQRRRRAVSNETAEDDDDEQAGEGMEVDEEDSQDHIVKNFVRYALACEFQRLPITRTGLKDKVHRHYTGHFKNIFNPTQEVLRTKFGMELVELPAKENVTVEGRLKDASKKSKTTAPSAYVLTSLLPIEYRTPDILQPSKVISQWDEATYIGVYTTIVSIIMLSPEGTISDSKFMSILQKLEAHENTPMDKTAVIIKRMLQQNYITKTVEKTQDEEIIDWRVGPRGKVEIGTKGVQGLAREVYGENAPEDLEKRLDRSLGLGKRKSQAEEEREAPETNGASTARRASKRGRNRGRRADEDEEDDDSDDNTE